jgi:ATP phosphoribosyltransferase regulatory subunit
MKSKKLFENILRSIKSRGFKYIDLPPVIEANHIVERSGETFKRFLFSFNDQKGKELCLRPDLTIASCIRYLSRKTKETEKVYYQGQAFRKTFNKKNSIIRNQMGFEIIGSKNEKKDDQNILETSILSIKSFGYKTGSLTVGNVEIFKLLLNKLDIPKRWRLRLQRHFWREKYFNVLLKRLETNSDVDPTVVEIDKNRYKKMLKEDKSKMISSRSIEEILKRFDNKINDPRRTKKGSKVSKIIKEFLNINCPINQAANKLNNFFKKNKINLRVEKKYFPITKNKYQKLNINFSSSFGRELEYYTGMVFSINIKSRSSNIEINGGRYDNLISDLGAIKKVPAVGAAINLS